MIRYTTLILKHWFIAFIVLVAGQALSAEESQDNILIGVLAYNGKQQALTRWKPTADYLSRFIDSYNFQIVPLTHEEFTHAINKDQLDFILTNPGHYISLEVKFGATRIATFKSRFHEKVLTQFGSVIFTRVDSGIEYMRDLKDQSMAAVSSLAFGGFQLAQSELLDQGIDVYSDLTLLWLGFPQTDIVREVLAAKADAGTVRSGILEKMAANGEINLSSIRILSSRASEYFPLLRSTALYPEWPIARLPRTDARLAEQVTITLLQMPEKAAPAIISGGAGWTIPLDYLNVHDLFRKLEIEPYAPVPLELKEFWQVYRHWVFLIGFLFLISVFTILLSFKTNRQLKRSEQLLSENRDKLETTIEQRTVELSKTNSALQEDIESRVQFENTLHEGCEVLQTMNTICSRQDLTREQRIQSIVDLACQYLRQELAIFSIYEDGKYHRCAVNSGNENLPSPLFDRFAQRALTDGQVVHYLNQDNWLSYIACGIYISSQRTGLLELGSPLHAGIEPIELKTTLPTELELQILQLLTQWLINELILLEQENSTNEQYRETRSRFAAVTKREREVLQLVANGESNKSIARELNISAKTVELHRSNLLRKTSANSSVQLIKLATQSRLVD